MSIKTVADLNGTHLGMRISVLTRNGVYTGRLSYISHDGLRDQVGRTSTVAVGEDDDGFHLDTLLYLPPETEVEVGSGTYRPDTQTNTGGEQE